MQKATPQNTTLAPGDLVCITVGSLSLNCRLEKVAAWGDMGWDLEYTILNPLPGHGNYGRWKQWADGGHVELLSRLAN